jgi:hypothetical protein
MMRKHTARRDALTVVARLRQEEQAATGTERAALRERLSIALKSIVDCVVFHPITGEIHLVAWSGKKVIAFRESGRVWHEFNVKLPGVSRETAETFLAEIEGTVKTITESQGGIVVTFDGDNEAEAVMMKLALFSDPPHRPDCS